MRVLGKEFSGIAPSMALVTLSKTSCSSYLGNEANKTSVNSNLGLLTESVQAH